VVLPLLLSLILVYAFPAAGQEGYNTISQSDCKQQAKNKHKKVRAYQARESTAEPIKPDLPGGVLGNLSNGQSDRSDEF
jgi:hypothetical protein